MSVAIAVGVGFLAGRLCWRLLRGQLAHAAFQRENYRAVPLPTACGLVIPMAVVIVEAGRTLASEVVLAAAAPLSVQRATVLLACVGFALLGLIDDIAGDADRRGFRGHLAALGSGQLTTGGLKLAGGAAVAIVVVSPFAGPGVAQLLADGALVALAANLANLLDRAPGRVGKCQVTAFVVIALVAGAPQSLMGVAVVSGAGLALLPDDLRERVMLGDTGANALGAVLGLAVVHTFSPATRVLVAAGLVLANVASEVVSFSSVIERLAPLRALDNVGRRASRP